MTGGAMPAGSGLRRAWIRACVVGELIGFLPPAIVGAALGALGAPDPLMVIGLTSAGLLEGAALGIAQAGVLRRHLPAVDGPHWVIATTAAAGFAWFVGMGGSSVLAAGALPTAVMLVAVVPAWIAGLLAMGIGQWLVLRRVVTHSARWIPVTATAWLIGVMLPIAALSLTPNAWPPWTFVVVGVAAAVAMGMTVGVITGSCLVRLATRVLSPGPGLRVG
jgi:hypothetical protein